MLDGLNDENVLSFLIGIDPMQSKGLRKLYLTQNFIHLHQKCMQ